MTTEPEPTTEPEAKPIREATIKDWDGGEVSTWSMTAEELLEERDDIIWVLLARVAELKAMVTPRPIKSAPKDEPVFVFCPEESDYGYTAAWVIGEKVVDQWEGDSRLEDGVQPTHWLPLPLDPTEVTE
jgi:hypothetical protein